MHIPINSQLRLISTLYLLSLRNKHNHSIQNEVLHLGTQTEKYLVNHIPSNCIPRREGILPS